MQGFGTRLSCSQRLLQRCHLPRQSWLLPFQESPAQQCQSHRCFFAPPLELSEDLKQLLKRAFQQARGSCDFSAVIVITQLATGSKPSYRTPTAEGCIIICCKFTCCSHTPERVLGMLLPGKICSMFRHARSGGSCLQAVGGASGGDELGSRALQASALGAARAVRTEPVIPVDPKSMAKAFRYSI